MHNIKEIQGASVDVCLVVISFSLAKCNPARRKSPSASRYFIDTKERQFSKIGLAASHHLDMHAGHLKLRGAHTVA